MATPPTARRSSSSISTWRTSTSPNRSALGQQIQRGGPDSPRITIVGVAGTINSIDLGQPVTKERVYRPATQQPPGGDGARAQDRRSIPRRSSPRSAAPCDRSIPSSRSPTCGRWSSGYRGRSSCGARRRCCWRSSDRWRSCSRRLASTACWRSASRSACASSAFGRRSAPTGVDPEAGLQAGTDDCGHRAGARARRPPSGVTRFMQTMLFGVRSYDPVVFAGVTIVLLRRRGRWRATCRPVARRASIRSSRCAMPEAIGQRPQRRTTGSQLMRRSSTSKTSMPGGLAWLALVGERFGNPESALLAFDHQLQAFETSPVSPGRRRKSPAHHRATELSNIFPSVVQPV